MSTLDRIEEFIAKYGGGADAVSEHGLYAIVAKRGGRKCYASFDAPEQSRDGILDCMIEAAADSVHSLLDKEGLASGFLPLRYAEKR